MVWSAGGRAVEVGGGRADGGEICACSVVGGNPFVAGRLDCLGQLVRVNSEGASVSLVHDLELQLPHSDLLGPNLRS